MPTPFSVTLDSGDTICALSYAAATSLALETTAILAHGAGAPQTHPFITHFARGLASRGLDVVTFNFLYMEQCRRRPDPVDRLEACFRAVIDNTRRRMASVTPRLIVSGKSMGRGIASQVVAGGDNLTVVGLVFLGYPLHPLGRPDQPRSAHLPSINAPMLFVQGSRDTFGTPAELRPVLTGCSNAELCVIEGGDHSFKLRGKQTRSLDEVCARAQDVIAAWVKQQIQPQGSRPAVRRRCNHVTSPKAVAVHEPLATG